MDVFEVCDRYMLHLGGDGVSNMGTMGEILKLL